MSRILSHQWTDKKPFTRRVRWYCSGWDRATEPEWTRDKDIRLKFEDEHGITHRFYGERKIDAEKDYNDFRNGIVTTLMLRREKK